MKSAARIPAKMAALETEHKDNGTEGVTRRPKNLLQKTRVNFIPVKNFSFRSRARETKFYDEIFRMKTCWRPIENPKVP